MNARRPLACVAAVGALLALSACEKPAPIVTVVSGGQSVYAEANTWARRVDALEAEFRALYRGTAIGAGPASNARQAQRP